MNAFELLTIHRNVLELMSSVSIEVGDVKYIGMYKEYRRMYTNDNLTDEVAEKFLASNPKGIAFFASQPNDWEDRVAKRIASKTKTLNDALVASLVEELGKEGATVDTVKEAFKNYEIDGKKVTAKALDSHIKAAQEAIANKGE